MRRPRFDRVGASALTVLGVGYFVFWGCYLASPQLRPAVPIAEEQRFDVGVQAYGTGPLVAAGGAGGYGRWKITPRLEVGGGLRLGGLYTGEFFYSGGNSGFTTVADLGVRGQLWRKDGLKLSLDASIVGEGALIGYADPLLAVGARLALPVTRDFEGWGLYTMPGVGAGLANGTPLDGVERPLNNPGFGAEARLPVGVYMGFPIGERMRLQSWAEAGIAGAAVNLGFVVLVSGYAAGGVGLQF
jgi:hypothetical protein